jgi:hypothetical protein
MKEMKTWKEIEMEGDGRRWKEIEMYDEGWNDGVGGGNQTSRRLNRVRIQP